MEQHDSRGESLKVSRRNLFGGVVLAMLAPQSMSAAVVADKLAQMDRVTLHYLLRGVAMLEQFGDPIVNEDAQGLIEQITPTIPDAEQYLTLYRHFARRGSLCFRRHEDDHVLRMLHHNAAHSQSVTFRYTDQEGEITNREVWPLAIVHPPYGIQFFAWCQLRNDYRRFFVEQVEGMQNGTVSFAQNRMALLSNLLQQEAIT